ncbi:VOC family protein [Micromonospora inositola]|uniref:Glyoxalase/Bleomycin resistance protein/Dioxygenase superfamily protein n=1 Tax=Micromonospora inositola TaxID=47865 RepID=A0A1C5JN92_9ACTN|nr:VOC family protein [Micromonospora inositola]SCG71997.1 Glyoxalase/Bleomycin resistance protein/Dioxygenase superfamily protein [Micromonospora inositola]
MRAPAPLAMQMRQQAFVTRLGTFGSTLDFWASAYGAGPFYVGDVEPQNVRFRGVATTARLRIALTFLGPVQIEVIAPLDDAPHVWNEPLDGVAELPAAGLFHHVLMETDDYDVARAQLLAAGLTDGLTADFSGRRLSYLDGRDWTGHYVELIEKTGWNDTLLDLMRQACAEFDGQFPRRDYLELVGEARARCAGAAGR